MPSFLDLPREIRDVIYEIVLDTPETAPSSPDSCRKRYRRLLKQEANHDDYGDCSYFLQQPPPTASRSLLRLNHQVRDETLAMLSRLSTTHAYRYVLDIMIESEVHLYPTWLLIPSSPAITPHIEVVDVTFRLFGDCGQQQSGWQTGYGDSGVMMWALFGLILGFLKHGPAWDDRHRLLAPGPETTIGTLDLNVISPPEPAGGFRVSARIRRDEEARMLHPKAVTEEMKSAMDSLLSFHKTMLRHSPFNGRIKRIRISLDGKVEKVWDLTMLTE